ncbi:MAG: AfsR family transcriptional regulator, partial [Gordonia sp. (in: high G+C Gram-positive bacteria)]
EIIGPPLDEYAAYLHGLYIVILHRTGATVPARLAAEQLRVALSWLVRGPTVNLPAVGAAAAAVSLALDLPADGRLAAAARGARYRRDFPIIDLGEGPSTRRTALLGVLRG